MGIFLLLCSCTGGNQPAAEADSLRFTNDIVLKTTPVKDQGSSSLCWAYAMLAMIETEHLMQGDSVNLSADYVARHFLREQMLQHIVIKHNTHPQPLPKGGEQGLFFLLGGNRRGLSSSQKEDQRGLSSSQKEYQRSLSSPQGGTEGGISSPQKEDQRGISSPQKEDRGGISSPQKEDRGGLSSPQGGTEGGFVTTRGTMPMLLRLIERYGLTHYDAYHHREGCNYNLLCRRLMQQTSIVGSYQSQIDATDSLLDEFIGTAPLHVFMLGCEYTARQFAHSVCRKDEYQMLTSYAHHPFGEEYPLEVADNRYGDAFLNVHIDTLMARLDRSLRQGHPACWEGDATEVGFSAARGVARLQNDSHAATDSERLMSMLSGKTTDDHCMAIVGMAHDQKGRKYYLMKNSWGTVGRYHGYIYMSENYLRLKTVALTIRRDDY